MKQPIENLKCSTAHPSFYHSTGKPTGEQGVCMELQHTIFGQAVGGDARIMNDRHGYVLFSNDLDRV